MVYHTPDSSTYSAIFAMLLILLIVIAIAYGSVQKVYQDYQDRREQYAKKDIVIRETDPSSGRLLNNDTVLYEDLTDEEADAIINALLKSGETNKEKLEELEEAVLQ